jgi:hypothetical protein
VFRAYRTPISYELAGTVSDASQFRLGARRELLAAAAAVAGEVRVLAEQYHLQRPRRGPRFSLFWKAFPGSDTVNPGAFVIFDMLAKGAYDALFTAYRCFQILIQAREGAAIICAEGIKHGSGQI